MQLYCSSNYLRNNGARVLVRKQVKRNHIYYLGKAMLRAREVFSSKYQGARCKPKLGCLGQVSLLSHHHVISFHEGQSVVVRNYIVVKNTTDRLPHSEIPN